MILDMSNLVILVSLLVNLDVLGFDIKEKLLLYCFFFGSGWHSNDVNVEIRQSGSLDATK